MIYTGMLALSCIFFFTGIHSPKLKETYFSDPTITSLHQKKVRDAHLTIREASFSSVEFETS